MIEDVSPEPSPSSLKVIEDFQLSENPQRSTYHPSINPLNRELKTSTA
jgi:hypothetical protein